MVDINGFAVCVMNSFVVLFRESVAFAFDVCCDYGGLLVCVCLVWMMLPLISVCLIVAIPTERWVVLLWFDFR